MAEAVAVISLLSSIVQLVDFGTKLIDRLNEFASATEDVPLCFRSIKSQLPLAIITLRRVEAQARSSRVSDADAQALKPVIDNSLYETKKLTEFLDSAVPVGKFSTFQKRLQALNSLRYDKKVQKCSDRLQANVQVLIFHQTTNHSDIVEHIREVLCKLTLSPPPQPSNFSFGLNLGHAPEVAEGTFVGRQAEVIQLDQWLTPSTVPSQSVTAIVGLGGLGKTQLSIMFAKQYHEKYSSIFWLNAKDELSLKQDFVRLSQVIGINQGSGSTGLADEDLVVQQVLRWLSWPDNDRWLLIFDNYDDPRLPGVKSPTGYDIRRYFPSRSQGSILITTRSHRLKFARQLKLAKLQNVNESIEILSSRSGRDLSDDSAAATLAQRLDGLPLALVTAGTYLGQSVESVAEYLHAYEEYWHELDDTAEELVEYEDRTLFSTWNLSLAHIRVQYPELAELLRLLAYFSNEGISYDLLQSGKESGLEWLSSLTVNQRQFSRAMARLHDYSLVEMSEDNYYLHSCVHDWTLQALNRDIHSPYFWLAVHCVALNVKDESERDYWQNNQRILPHAIRLEHKRFCGILEEEQLTGTRSADLKSLAWLWIYQRQFLKAEKMSQIVLAHREKIFGPTHLLTLDAVHDFGALHSFQGKTVEAEKLYQRALTGREKDLGLDHASTLDTVHNLGVVYRAQRELGKAEQMYERALAGKEKRLGPDATSTINTVYNLGILYKDQRKMAKAEQMYQRALAGYEKTLGPDHTSTINTVYNLGILYKDQRKMVEAEQMYQRALAGWETTLGLDHTSTFDAVHSLGILYYDQKKMVEAEQMYRRALAGYETTAGSHHISTLNTVHNLGSLFRDQGKMAEAEEMYQRALVGYEKAIGPNHTSTLDTVNDLGSLYRDQGKMAEAEEMYQRALVVNEKFLGPNHASTVETINNIAVLYSDQRKMAEAEEMFLKALAGKEKVLGHGHTSTLNTVYNLGLLYRDQGKMTKAEEMYRRALAGYEKALGPDHISTLDTVKNLGALYCDQGRLAKAEEMYQRALEGREKALGLNHTSTLNTVHSLGILYYGQKKMMEAEQMFQRVLMGYETTLGFHHTSTLDVVYNLGILYFKQKKMVKAEQMYQRALGGREKALGLGHTSTLDTVNSLSLLYRDQGKMMEAEEMYRRAMAGYEKALGLDHTSPLKTVHNLAALHSAHGRLAECIKLAYSWGTKSAALFGALGRMLIKHSDETNAKIAFQQEIGYESGIMIFKNIRCDGCDLSITCAMRRFVCKDCSDVDLCGECLVKHETGVREVPTCSLHSFLEIASQTSSGSEQGSVTEETSRTSWLQDLIMKYAEKAA